MTGRSNQPHRVQARRKVALANIQTRLSSDFYQIREETLKKFPDIREAIERKIGKAKAEATILEERLKHHGTFN